MVTHASGPDPPPRTDPGASRDIEINAERRVVTILAVDIFSSTEHIRDSDPEDAQAFFDACFSHLHTAIEAAGGTLVSYEGDGGIAVFGWPRPQEDHADRALTAAWDVQHGARPPTGPDGKTVRFRVALNSGLVAVRELRRVGRTRLDVIGAAVHVAAKLQQRAEPGTVLVAASTIHLCRSAIQLSPCPVSGELAVMAGAVSRLETRPRATAASDVANRYRLPLIGREAELAALRALLPRAGEAGNALALVGEAGIGKSRLGAAIAADAAVEGARRLVFFGDSATLAAAFTLPRVLLRELLDLPEIDVTAVALRTALDHPRCAMLGVDDLGAITDLLAPGTRTRSGGTRTGMQVARGLASAFRQIVCDRPTLLLVEDLQLLDAESQLFLRLLVGASAPSLCVLVTGRPEISVEARAIAGDILEVGPLLPDAMRRLAFRLRGDGGGSAPAAIDALVARAEGVPLVLEELVRAHSGASPDAPPESPQGVVSLIHARLQLVSAGARSLAQALSVIGDGAEPEFLAAVLDRAPEAIYCDFAELERFAFVHPATGPAMHMRHQIISEACADTVPRLRRRQLHRSAVTAIEAGNAALPGRWGRLAFHAEAADDLAAAIDFMWRAALEARRDGAAASINHLFDRAMPLIARAGEAAEERYVDLVLMASASLLQLGEFDKVNVHLPRVVALVRRDGTPARIASALSQLGMVRWFAGRYAEGLAATEEGLAIARALGSPALIYSNAIMQTNILHGMGAVDRAIEEQRALSALLSGKLATARLGAAGRPRVTTLAFLAWYLVERGEHTEALVSAETALALAQGEGDRYGETIARNALGRTLSLLNRDAEAVHCFAAALAISEADGYDAIVPHLTGRMAAALSRTGRGAEAIALVESCVARDFAPRTGRLELYALALGHAEALLASGETDCGLAKLDAALAVAREIGNPCAAVEALRLRSWVLARAMPGDPRLASDLTECRVLVDRHHLADRPPPPFWATAG